MDHATIRANGAAFHVVRTGRGLRVVLHREGAPVEQRNTFHHTVVGAGVADHGAAERGVELGAALALQEGRVALDDGAGPPGATLRHLLAHASGYFYESDATLQAPGLRRHYSNYGIDEAARHVERAVGRDFGDWVQERIADPLGMTGLHWEGSASVGASGALVDLALLAAELQHPTLLDQEVHAQLVGIHFPDLVGIMPGFGKQDPNPFGLGIEVRGSKSPHWTATAGSERTYGHFGMRGTAFWIDPEADLALVVGTSHDFCDAHREIMPRLGDAVLAAHR